MCVRGECPDEEGVKGGAGTGCEVLDGGQDIHRLTLGTRGCNAEWMRQPYNTVCSEYAPSPPAGGACNSSQHAEKDYTTHLDVEECVERHVVPECLLDVCCQLLLVLQLDCPPLLLEGSVLSIRLQLGQLVGVSDPAAVRGERGTSGRVVFSDIVASNFCKASLHHQQWCLGDERVTLSEVC